MTKYPFRLLFLCSVALLLETGPVPAQEMGGVMPPPGALKPENVGGIVGHLAAQLQLEAMLRANGTAARGPVNAANTPDPGAGTAAPAASPAFPGGQGAQLIGRLRGDPGFLGGFVFGQPLAASLARRNAPADPVVVNNFDGPVAIGNSSQVTQQIANTTAIGVGQVSARAAAGIGTVPGGGGPTGQTALSQAVSIGGGTARATSVNSQANRQAISQGSP